MESKIRVMVFEPLREPHIEHIKNTEEVYKNIVEGEYKAQALDKNTVLVHNAKDKELQLTGNRYVGRDIICGTFFIAADNREGKLNSLSIKQAQYYYNRYKKAEEVSQQYVKEHYLYSCEGIGKDELYINNINMRLDEFDFQKVAESYKTHEFTEAKELLKMLHREFCESFGTSSVDELLYGDDIYINLPVVMRSQKTGDFCVGLVHVDLESSGELYGAQFAFSNGFVALDDYDKNNSMVQERMAFGPFEYWFTVDYHDDIHAAKGAVPKEVQGLLDYARGIEEQTQGMNMDGM